MRVVLNGDAIKDRQDFHKQLKILLDLPNYYGENLDALWDCFTAWLEFPLILVWKDFTKSQIYLGEYADKCLLFFQEVEQEIDGFVFILE
jgi:ribonuclease inhibitor